MVVSDMIVLMLATFMLVFLKAWQQQNVIHGYYKWAAITSYGLAIAEVLVVVGIVEYGLMAVFYIGTGGAVGVVSAMKLHKRMQKNGK